MIYKRGDLYWYKFMWQGKLVRQSTKQGNDKVARQIEAAHRTSLAKGEVGIRERKVAPSLSEFLTGRVEPWAKARLETASPHGWGWYENGMRALRNGSLAKTKLDEITSERVAAFAGQLQAKKLQPGTINTYLRVLRRALRLAVKWDVLITAPTFELLPGEHRREFVLTQEEESRYFAAAREPLASVATVLADTGMRPDECYRLRWEQVTWANGRNGTVLVTRGKTAAACRVLPLTTRVRAVLEARWEMVGKPSEGWVWPVTSTRSGHVEKFSLRYAHKQAVERSHVRPFVLYSLRHTFLTRLGVSGCDVWTLARIAGHSNIAISKRYVHPDEDAVLRAIDQLNTLSA